MKWLLPQRLFHTSDLLRSKVVADASSQFTGTERICSIEANHMDMCRFSSRNDIGYVRFTDALNSILAPLTKGLNQRGQGRETFEQDEIVERQ